MSYLQFDREKTNLGGVNKFLFAFEEIFSSAIEIVNFLATGIDEADFNQAELVLESAELKETIVADNFFNYQFTAKVARDDSNRLADCVKFDSSRIIAILVDNNGKKRLLGNFGNACELKAQFVKGSRVADLNHISIELNWKTNQRAAFV